MVNLAARVGDGFQENEKERDKAKGKILYYRSSRLGLRPFAAGNLTFRFLVSGLGEDRAGDGESRPRWKNWAVDQQAEVILVICPYHASHPSHVSCL